MSLSEIAGVALSFLERREDSAAKRIWWTLVDGAPEWMLDLARGAHDEGEMLPEDRRYAQVVDALRWLQEGGNPDEYEPEADVYYYYSDLREWLASHHLRAGYCDEAMEAYGAPAEGGIYALIQMGQEYELRQVMASIADSLSRRLEVVAPDGE